MTGKHRPATTSVAIPASRAARASTLVVRAPDGAQLRKRLPHDAYLAIIAATNMKQRTRKQLEYHHADRLNYAVAGTPNRLEYDQGFFVKNGDGAADVKPVAHLYKTQVYQMAEHLGVPEEVRQRPPTTDTWSMPQSQEEFYFSVDHAAMDLCLCALERGAPADEAAAAAGLSVAQVEAVWSDIAAKRKVAAYLHAPPLLVEDAAIARVRTMAPDISVVIPTFRRPDLLVEAIESVLRQKAAAIEIRVIDDCPLGSAREAVAPYLDRGVIYRRSPSPSGGRPALPRNLGLQDARAEIVHFLDDDDLAPEGFYADALEVFARKPGIGVIFGKVAPFGENDVEIRARLFRPGASPRPPLPAPGPKTRLRRRPVLSRGAAGVRRGDDPQAAATSMSAAFRLVRRCPRTWISTPAPSADTARSASIGPRCITASALRSAVAPTSACCCRLPLGTSSRAAGSTAARSTSMR